MQALGRPLYDRGLSGSAAAHQAAGHWQLGWLWWRTDRGLQNGPCMVWDSGHGTKMSVEDAHSCVHISCEQVYRETPAHTCLGISTEILIKHCIA